MKYKCKIYDIYININDKYKIAYSTLNPETENLSIHVFTCIIYFSKVVLNNNNNNNKKLLIMYK